VSPGGVGPTVVAGPHAPPVVGDDPGLES
jgi:hypothetical protein